MFIYSGDRDRRERSPRRNDAHHAEQPRVEHAERNTRRSRSVRAIMTARWHLSCTLQRDESSSSESASSDEE